VPRATLLFILFVLAGGCHRNVILAHKLQAEYSAPVYASLRQVDLAGLSRSVPWSGQLNPGDLVQVTINTGWESEPPATWPLRISRTGTVTVPLLGSIQIAGLELSQAEEAIRAESIRRGMYVDPNVVIEMKERRSNRITVMGAVRNPKPYELPVVESDLLSALAAAGGLTESASTIVEIKQPRAGDSDVVQAGYIDGPGEGGLEEVIHVDLAELPQSGDQGLELLDGAVVVVKERPPRHIQVLGLVRKPGQFEIPDGQEIRLLDALSLAADRTVQHADKVKVIRRTERDGPITIRASVKRAKRDGSANIRLADGDVVFVEETPVTFLTQTMQQFIRLGVSTPIY
jgi:polysaccharide export outer membrane protein